MPTIRKSAVYHASSAALAIVHEAPTCFYFHPPVPPHFSHFFWVLMHHSPQVSFFGTYLPSQGLLGSADDTGWDSPVP